MDLDMDLEPQKPQTLHHPVAAFTQRDAGDALGRDAAGTTRDDGCYVRDGFLATTTEVVHYLAGVGRARVRLRCDAAVVEEWRSQGLSGCPLLRNHGSDNFDDWFTGPVLRHRLGRIENLRSEKDERGMDGIAGDFVFDPELAREYIGPVQRGTLREVSVQFEVRELRLVEQLDGKLPLYEAARWMPIEGSLVWAGADHAAMLRSSMDPKLFAETIEKAVQRGVQSAMAAAPAPPPVPAAAHAPAPAESQPVRESSEDLWDKLTTKAIDDVGAERAQDLIVRANGNSQVLGALLRAEKARQPAAAPIPARDMGLPGHHRALADLITITLARGASHREEYALAASKADANWRHFTTFDLVARVARSMGLPVDATGNRLGLLRSMFRGRPNNAEIIEGASYYRDPTLGLVPADLEAAFRDIVYKQVMGTYMKDRLPFERFAYIKNVNDLRDVTLIWYDVAGNFAPLAKEENLRPLTARELEGKFKAQPYGFIHKIGYHAIINDDIELIVRLPAAIGEWCAAGENKAFQTALLSGTLPSGSSVWTGDNDLAVATVTDYKAHLETVRQRALAATPVPAKADEAPSNDPHSGYSLVPTVLLYGRNHDNPWFEYMAAADERTFDTRAETIRRPYLRTLFANSREGLYLPVNNLYAYPGPESIFCPMTVGRVIGEEMRVELAETGPREMDGIYIRCLDTFGASMVISGKAYRIRPNA